MNVTSPQRKRLMLMLFAKLPTIWMQPMTSSCFESHPQSPFFYPRCVPTDDETIMGDCKLKLKWEMYLWTFSLWRDICGYFLFFSNFQTCNDGSSFEHVETCSELVIDHDFGLYLRYNYSRKKLRSIFEIRCILITQTRCSYSIIFACCLVKSMNQVSI